jgi:hypothetical protein
MRFQLLSFFTRLRAMRPLLLASSLLVAMRLLLPGSLCAQSDQLFLLNGQQLSGKIAKETPGLGFQLQLPTYELRFVAEDELEAVLRPPAIAGYWEVIYLKKGGELRGFLLEYTWPSDLLLEDERGNRFGLYLDEILRIEKEPVPSNELLERSKYMARKERQKTWRSERANNRGYGLLFVEAGPMLVSDQSGTWYPGFFGQGIASLTISPRYTVGIGLGTDAVLIGNGNVSEGRYLFLDQRFYLPRETWEPYVYLSAGADWFRSRGFLSPGIGGRKKIFNRFWLNGKLSFKVQRVGSDPIGGVFSNGWLEMMQFALVID